MSTTTARRVIRTAAAEVGVTETPAGSNTGPRVRAYQAVTDLGGTGWPWCAAFVEWVWQRAGVSTQACSPSTQRMADLARGLGWVGAPVPGAAIIWPGVHTEILVAPVAPGVWATIGGNTGDSVARRVRALTGTIIAVPPELRDQTPNDQPRAYWVEDPAAQPTLLGPWRTTRMRDRALTRLDPARARTARRVTAGENQKPAILIGPRRLYGPWLDEAARDDALVVLQRRLGRRLRAFSRVIPAPTTTNGAAEALGRTT